MSFEITPADVPALALGSSVLACGGGGNAYYGRLVAQSLLERHGAVRVIDLDEMAADRLAVSPGIMGAPLVGIEKPPSLPALGAGFEAVRRVCAAERSGSEVTARRAMHPAKVNPEQRGARTPTARGANAPPSNSLSVSLRKARATIQSDPWHSVIPMPRKPAVSGPQIASQMRFAVDLAARVWSSMKNGRGRCRDGGGE